MMLYWWNGMQYSPYSGKVLVDGRKCRLSRQQNRMFSQLYDNQGKVVPWKIFLKALWGRERLTPKLKRYLQTIAWNISEETNLTIRSRKTGLILKG